MTGLVDNKIYLNQILNVVEPGKMTFALHFDANLFEGNNQGNSVDPEVADMLIKFKNKIRKV